MNVTGSDTGQGSRNQLFGDPDIIKNYFKEESTNQDEKPQECNPSLDEWMKRNWGTTKVDKKAKIKAFVEWMVENDPDDAKPSDHDSDPYDRSFEKFNYEFETEVLKLLDDYELKIGKRGSMLANAWDSCEKTYNGKRSFWHKNELEAMEVQDCQIKGIKYDPPEIQMETFKIWRYTVGGIRRFICTEKSLERRLPVGRMNGEKFKDLIREELNAGDGVEPT